jgi:CBS domain-containing protein
MAQQIRELMIPNPVALPGTASVHEAARAMRDADIGDVIVGLDHGVGYPSCLGKRQNSLSARGKEYAHIPRPAAWSHVAEGVIET